MAGACSVCLNPKAPQTCRGCSEALCKTCANFVSDDDFLYANIPEEKSPTGNYCITCYNSQIVPKLEKYNEVLALAKDVNVFTIDQGQESRLVKRSDLNLKIDACDDKEELQMKLAYQAAKAGFNTIVDTDLVYAKKREGSFKISNWSGTATAAWVPPDKIQARSNRKSPSR